MENLNNFPCEGKEVVKTIDIFLQFFKLNSKFVTVFFTRFRHSTWAIVVCLVSDATFYTPKHEFRSQKHWFTTTAITYTAITSASPVNCEGIYAHHIINNVFVGTLLMGWDTVVHTNWSFGIFSGSENYTFWAYQRIFLFICQSQIFLPAFIFQWQY